MVTGPAKDQMVLQDSIAMSSSALSPSSTSLFNLTSFWYFKVASFKYQFQSVSVWLKWLQCIAMMKLSLKVQPCVIICWNVDGNKMEKRLFIDWYKSSHFSKADPVVNQIIAKASQSTMSQHFDLDDCFHLSPVHRAASPSLPSCCTGRTQLGLMHIKTSKYAHHHHHYCRQ